MAKAKKLPSGNWRVQVYSHTDSNGRKIRESFTASTKAEAEMLAARFAHNTDRKREANVTVKEALELYIDSNTNVLSPSTIDGYRKDMRRLEPIYHIRIRKINSLDIQDYIQLLINKGLSPKTVRNTYGLLRAALSFCGIKQDFSIHLPSVKRSLKYAPENHQIAALYESASPKMKIAISLAAFHSLRRGEISALTYGDLKGNTLYVHSDMVKSADGKGWVHKEIPKTESSNRTVYLTDEELALIGTGQPNEYIVPILPGTIGTNFYNLKKKVGIEIRFHDLRVYFASISATMMNETTLAHLGGWKEGSSVLKQHYMKPIKTIDEQAADKMNTFFKNVLEKSSHESSLEK